MPNDQDNKSKQPRRKNPKKQAPEKTTPRNFPIVALGSSAGGLAALKKFFGHVPSNPGMAFVVISHQHPGHESILTELLARETDLQVVTIDNNMEVHPDHAYVLGPQNNASIKDGVLHLEKKSTESRHRMPIDSFFRSLAEDMRERAVAVVLSGTGSDGTLGVREIKAQGGMAMAQKTSTAEYGGMPGNAINTGQVDIVSPPEELFENLADYVKGPYLQSGARTTEEEKTPDSQLETILQFLRSKVKHDFSSYKRSTIRRRIERRMSVHGLENAGEYLDFLHENVQESQLLFSELLISVTSFFRDPDAFGALSKKYLPDLIRSRSDDDGFRVWIPGCATGEEAYSIAMIIDEVRHRLKKNLTVQVFGTDLDHAAIHRARQGAYPSSIAADVSPDRLAKYFTREGEDSFSVRKSIRDMLVFAPQNVLSDPPFLRVDLLVCRNLLLYLQQELQKQLLPTFHYALKPGGLLFLGSSESVGSHTDLFEMLDARWKIYRRKDVPTGLPRVPISPAREGSEEPAPRKHDQQRPPASNRSFERFLANRFAPVSVIVDRHGTISYIHGRTGAFLEPEQETPKNNVLDMAREGLKLPLAAVFHRALAQNKEVKRRGVDVKTNGDYTTVDVAVAPIEDPEPLRGLVLISIAYAEPPRPAPTTTPASESSSVSKEKVRELESELLSVRESNQTMVEELQSSNEELQSSNEELQSTNEELQSSKEEMESLNEELSTVNAELNTKVQELGQARDDMRNLLNSTDLGVIFLDQQLRVKRYTERARGFVSLRDSDIGRPIEELSGKLQYDSLIKDCHEVLDTLVRKEEEVLTDEGSWQLMRILPYRTSENVIGGVVITFIDVSHLKREETGIQGMVRYFQDIVNTVRSPLLVLDDSLRVQTVNDAFLRTFQTSSEDNNGKKVYDLGNGQWNIAPLRTLLEDILRKDTVFNDFEVEHDFPKIGTKRFLLNARRLKRPDEEGTRELILLAMEEAK